MKRKNWTTRVISGLLSAVIVLSAAVTPVTAFASELLPEEELKAYVEALPELDQVKDTLDADEIVTAKDLEVEFSAEIDLKKDITNIEIPDKEKVNVKFYEAKDADKADFSTERAGTYKAVYYVEPANEQHPVYRISRNITVKEPVTEAQTEGQSSDGGDGSGESEDAEDAEADPEPQTQAVTAPETEAAEIAETAAPETAAETEEAHIIYEFTEEAYELEMAAAEETAQSLEVQASATTQDVTSAPVTAETESSAQEVTAVDLTAALEAVLSSEADPALEESEPIETEVPETEPVETEVAPESEPAELTVGETDPSGSITEEVPEEEASQKETEEAIPAETETESEAETDKGGFQVNVTEGEELGITLDHEDGIYQPGETVSVSTDLPAGTLTAVAALKQESNEKINTEDLLYSEVSYNAPADTFTFEMPAEDIALEVRTDIALGTMMLAAAASNEDSWDDATEIEANKYYYYSDGTLHPFNSVMGSGGNDSYKYVRYKVGGKTYTVNAYCMQHSMSAPPSGTTYTQMIDLEEGGDDKYLRKALFYGYGGPGWGDTFNGYNIQSIMQKYGCGSETRAMQHYLVDYLYDGESGFGGALSNTAKDMLKEIKAALKAMPDPSAIELKPALSTTATGKDTETFTWKANEAFVITVHLENGVSLVNETTGKTGTGNVKVKGGEKFHLTATTDNISSLKGVYDITCNYPMNFHGMLLKLQNSQDIGFGYYTDGDDIKLTVDWPETAKLEIVKEDGSTHAKLAGAIYGVYSDEACTKLIVKMPATDAKGASKVEFNVTGSKVYLKELTAPKGYKVSAKATGVSVSAGKTSSATLPDEEIKGKLVVYKEGQVLTGATSDNNGTTFKYETKKLAGAKYSVTAGADIVSAGGTVVYKKGATVANLTTDKNGEAVLDNLTLGSYVITETGAPANYVNKGESKTVTLKEGSTSAEAVVGTATFSNDRQKVEVTALKQDKLTQTPVSGAVYGLYADAEIKNNAGTVIVKKDALIGKATTGTDGKGKFAADLPLGNKFYVKELTAPKGYKLNGSDTYRFTTAYTNDKQVSISFSHTFENEEIRGKLTIYKEGEVLVGADVTDAGTVFKYEIQKQKGAAFAVYAGAEIKSAGGKVIYKKGDLVKDGLVTGDDGSVSLDNLFLGTYTVKETGAPKNYVLNGESKDITLSLANLSGEVVLGSVTIRNDRQKVAVNVFKQDKLTQTPVGGAVYGLYADAEIKNNAGTVIVKKDALIGKVTTGTDGKGKFAADLPLNNKFYVKELTAPTGYKLNGSDIYRFTTTYTNDKQASITFAHTFENEEIRGKLTIYKEGEVLVGADVTDAGTVFKYEVRKQKGATFAVYAGAEIKSAGGRVIYKKGDLVKDGLVTGDDGSVSLDNLFLGTYTVKETGAPKNFVLNGESKDITLSIEKLEGEVVLGSVTIKNDRQKAKVTVVKQDDTTKNPLPGGVYGLYAGADIKAANGTVVVKKDTFIEKVTTGADGSAVYKSDLPLNNSYYVKEMQAPKNYFRNQNDVFPFTFSYTNEKQAEVAFSHTFKNERVDARIDLIKVDAETGEPQGDAKLGKATYGLFARENIVHPDGKTGILYKAGAQVATLTTDDDGKAFIEDLYLGKYFIKELIPSEGYLLDEKEYDLDCAYEGDLVKTVKKTATSKEQVIKQPFQVIKAANNGKTDADLLKGVGFSAYLISSLQTKKDGSYDFSKAKPIVLTENGGTEMFTDEKGYAVSIPIPYGKYIIRETTTPHNFTPVDDFKVTISENHPKEPQQWRVLLDDEFEAKLMIIKKDDETKKPVLLPKTEFKVYDMDNKKYVEQVTTYPSVVTHKSYFTDENGYLILPNNLKIGHYRIEEVNAPYGYVLNHNAFEVLVDSNTAYQMDQTSGDAIIEVVMENQPVKGKLTIKKSGEVLASFDKDFGYEMTSLADAEFAVYAAEDIYTPDYQRDENGNRIVIYAKDALVAMVTTGADGSAVVEDLPLGTYRIEETKAPFGFVLNTEPQTVTFAYADQETPVIGQTAEFTNDRQKVEITVEKQDVETGKKLSGAVFGLYAASAIASADHEKVLVEADTLLEEATSDENGLAAFMLDLPIGQYYVKEHKAPAGYVSSDEILNFDAGYQGQDVPVVKLTSVKRNEPTTFEFTKSDITTGTELEGAVLTILTRSGDVIERWTSVKNEPHMVKCLTAGESYVLREEFAPYGYLRATDVVFTVKDTAEIQKVEMKDEVPTALLIINKKGEFLDKVTLLDNTKGTVEHMFEYISGNLTPVTFEVYAAEDIHAADEAQPDYYKKDDLVGTITTDDTGIAKVGDLPVGKYYVVEKETAYGYVLDNAPRFVDLSYRDQDTPIVVYDEKWQNARQKVSLHLVKKEKGTEAPLKGAIFGLYTAEDIKSKDGKVLIEKDTLIEQKTTDVNGEIGFIADLPIDGKYYVTELFAPNGYVNAQEKQDFTFTYGGSDKDLLSYSFTFVNEPTTVELSKADITTGKELPGAHLRVIDENAVLIDEWVSTETPHIIQKLVVGREYELIETKPADGYVTAESVTFKIENTGEVQKMKMEDDVTKVYLSKSDITDGKPVIGAKLSIIDETGDVVETWTTTEKEHYIEKLPVGKYTLREETAPAGYLVAEDVLFTVKDTGVEQKVEMKDDYTKVEITKSDITDGKPVIGAKLTILDKDGKEVESWVTEEKPHYIEKLPVGEYTLREVTAPDGYLRAEDVKFTVKETGEIQKVAMKDDYTKVEISKQDITNSKEIPGAKLTIFDKDGKEVESWVSKEKPHYIEKLLVGEYTLREVTAPEGYEVAEDVKFTVAETGEIQTVVMKDAPKKQPETPTTETPTNPSTPTNPTNPSTPTTTTETPKETPTTPKTGDDRNPLLWLLLFGIGGCMAGAAWYLRKKDEKDQNQD